MPVSLPPPATRPTMYFVGVSTGASSIAAVYAAWRSELGIPDSQLVGIDLPIGAPVQDYRTVASFLTEDPQSCGALVTTHKLALYAACGDLFDEISPAARTLAEVSCLTAGDGRLGAHALDPLTSSLALEAILPDRRPREYLVMGSGGAALALAQHLLGRPAGEVPRLVVTDVDAERLGPARALIDEHGHAEGTYELVHAGSATTHDDILASLAPGSVVVNATGTGKDRPGSPLTPDAEFPLDGIAWDFNYRGELGFLEQARAQQHRRNLRVEDGWTYFVHGWTRAIATVFDLDVPVRGERFDHLSDLARRAR